MLEFNNMTIVASAKILAEAHTHAQLDGLALEWGLQNRTTGSALSRTTSFAQIAIDENPLVMTPEGKKNLARAMIEKAITVNQRIRKRLDEEWLKLEAGLHLDGFEIVENWTETEGVGLFGAPNKELNIGLRKMLPEDVPETDFREAESELTELLKKYDFSIPLGHLEQAFSSFSKGHWASANGDLRSFFEGLLNEIATKLGCDQDKKTAQKRQYLASIEPPFLYSEYNEWSSNDNKPQYIRGLWARMHPHGSHPGLSEEDDCTFRLQITLVSARLFLRRFNQRMKGTV